MLGICAHRTAGVDVKLPLQMAGTNGETGQVSGPYLYSREVRPEQALIKVRLDLDAVSASAVR